MKNKLKSCSFGNHAVEVVQYSDDEYGIACFHCDCEFGKYFPTIAETTTWWNNKEAGGEVAVVEFYDNLTELVKE